MTTQITIDARIAEIKKPQTNFRGEIVPIPSEKTINDWVAIMTELTEVSNLCEKQFKARANAQKKQLNKEQYDALHDRQIKLSDKAREFRLEVKSDTGFYLKWAI